MIGSESYATVAYAVLAVDLNDRSQGYEPCGMV